MLQGELSENPVACVQVMYLYSQFHFFDTMLLGFVVFVSLLQFFFFVLFSIVFFWGGEGGGL